MRLTLLLFAVARAALGQGAFFEWTLPTPNSQPHCVAADSRGRIWYAAIGAGLVGMFDPATQQFKELPVPTPNSMPHGIAVSPGDVIWFTEQGANRIGRIHPDTFAITEYPLPNPGSGPHTPIYDGRGGVWFTEQSGNRIGRINVASGAIEEFAIPTPNSGPYGIVADAQGNAWFCAFGAGSNRIGRVDARTGAIREYGTPTRDSGPRRPWIDSKGRIWITENRAGKIALFDPSTETFREWDSPARDGQPYGIVVDRRDQVWYNEFEANNLVRFDPATEKFSVYPFPVSREFVRIVAVDQADRVWYGNNRDSRLGMIVPGGVAANAAGEVPALGLAPGTLVSIYGMGLAGAAGDTTASFDDTPATVTFASPGQVNVQVPEALPDGAAILRLRRGQALTLTQPVTIQAASPGIFTLNGQGTGPGVIAHADTFRLVTESEPARPGEFLSIFCTGLGRLGTASPRETVRRAQAAIGGKPALVTYSGEAPGLPGVNQVNVQVTADAPAGMLPLEIAIGGVASNTVTLLVSEARGGAPSRRARR